MAEEGRFDFEAEDEEEVVGAVGAQEEDDDDEDEEDRRGRRRRGGGGGGGGGVAAAVRSVSGVWGGSGSGSEYARSREQPSSGRPAARQAAGPASDRDRDQDRHRERADRAWERDQDRDTDPRTGSGRDQAAGSSGGGEDGYGYAAYGGYGPGAGYGHPGGGGPGYGPYGYWGYGGGGPGYGPWGMGMPAGPGYGYGGPGYGPESRGFNEDLRSWKRPRLGEGFGGMGPGHGHGPGPAFGMTDRPRSDNGNGTDGPPTPASNTTTTTTTIHNTNSGPSNSNTMRPPFWRTRICKLWLSPEGCPYGPRCNFAHGDEELVRSSADLNSPANANAPPPKLCKQFLTNPSGCQYGDRCQFYHDWNAKVAMENGAPGPLDLAVGPPTGAGTPVGAAGAGGGAGGAGGAAGNKPWQPAAWKTKVCAQWEAGNCRFGEKCRFAHGPQDLRQFGTGPPLELLNEQGFYADEMYEHPPAPVSRPNPNITNNNTRHVATANQHNLHNQTHLQQSYAPVRVQGDHADQRDRSGSANSGTLEGRNRDWDQGVGAGADANGYVDVSILGSSAYAD